MGEGLNEGKRNALEAPFNDKEIKDVVKDLPNDKSTGPDGFNNEIYKNCWQIIGDDVKALTKKIHNGNILPESRNSSYITLIPKIDSPL
jgi:hypothetical protein